MTDKTTTTEDTTADTVTNLATSAASTLTGALGLPISGDQLKALANGIIDLVKNGEWQKVEAAGAEAAKTITNLREAEEEERS